MLVLVAICFHSSNGFFHLPPQNPRGPQLIYNTCTNCIYGTIVALMLSFHLPIPKLSGPQLTKFEECHILHH